MKRLIALILMMTFCAAFLAGCSNSESTVWNPLSNGGTLNIAILGSDEEFETRTDFMAGVDLAIEDLANKGVKVSYTKFSDAENYDQAVTNAKNVINDEQYILAITLQSEEVVDTISKLFNDANKPLIVANTCEENNKSQDYKYVLNGLITGEQAGEALGNYAISNNFNSLAAIHSASERNVAIVEGIENSVSKNANTLLVDAFLPEGDKAFLDVIERWQILGIDAIVVALEDIDLASNFIKLLKERAPEILVMGDYTFNNQKYLDSYGSYLEGMILSASYPVDSNEKLEQFYAQYEPKITYVDITSITAQAYDFVNMIVEKLDGTSNSEEFINNMKSSEGYEGITGVRFDENGNLNKESDYWIIKDSKVYRLDNNNIA